MAKGGARPPMLTDANKTVGAALSLHFNSEHYDKTRELIAWPAWETLMAETALGKTAIYEGITQLEHVRLLDVERGRYDHTAQRRTGNIYHVPPRFAVANLAPQGSRPRFATKVRRGEQDSLNRLSESDSLIKKKRVKKAGPPKEEGMESKQGKQGKQGPEKDSSPSKVPSSSPVRAPHPPSSARPPSPLVDRWADRWRREKAEAEATLEHYRAKALAAQNGGGQ